MAVGQADSVAALFVDVQFVGNMVLLERKGEEHAVVREDAGVIGSVPKKSRRCVFGNLKFVRKELDQIIRRIFAEEILFGTLVRFFAKGDYWVAENPKIGAGALLVDFIRGIGITRIKMRQK